MFTRFIKYAFYCLFFFILASGELDGFKSHNTNECNIIDNEYCIHKPLKGYEKPSVRYYDKNLKYQRNVKN
ncbi:hypothetical protein BpHYR1_004977 [Brachionus plicatilis]|uniref:Uncharacterized protein n=1 Tax=Brachionus plicatilis TaxID=10195 RepID=A0A3M7T0M6_BRAPC|nr:hypothetical protein BpHYR1_004977 [Brachionus plicatilis]